MGKNPAFLFYPGDWERDLEEHPLEIEGAWIRICCKLWWSDKRGVASKTLDQWSRVLRLTPKKTEKILEYLSQHSVATLVKQNSTIEITCRRIVRDEYIRTVRKAAGSKGGNPKLKPDGLLNQNAKQKSTLSVSSSVSVTDTKKQKLKKSIYGESFHRVNLTEEERAKLDVAYGSSKAKEMIENMDLYLESKGDKYKSHYATLLSWERKNNGGHDGRPRSGQHAVEGKASGARNLGDGQAYPVDLEVTE